MLISEIYCSRQGEGLLTGIPSAFIRTSGCNLRCSFCDTPFASWEPEGQQLKISEIIKATQKTVDQADPSPVRHVVITGGEPMLPREINQLSREIRTAGFHITIETAGTIFREPTCDLMSVSPKLANSDPSQGRAGEWRTTHQRTRHRPDIVQKLIDHYQYQLKFVVDAPGDVDEILEYLRQVKNVDLSRVLLMPQGVEPGELETRSRWLLPICEQHGFTFCPRRHIEWFGNRRGT